MKHPSRIILRTVQLPNIGVPREPRPELPPRVFASRVRALRQRMKQRGLDAMVVYADREHFANLHYLTNYDPRFEEALLIVRPAGTPILFVGNEGMGYSQVARLPVERRLYQTFSLLGQPREKVRELSELLREAGLGRCRRVGTAGWKYFSSREFKDAAHVLDLPDFIAASIRAAPPKGGAVTNETAIFMDAGDGLRSLLEPEQIAYFEWVATVNSQNLLDGIRALRPGLTEFEALSRMRICGLPFAAHPICASGENVRRCVMPSPTSRKLRLGDPVLLACTYQGANTCRFGWVARGEGDLPRAVRDYASRTAMPYFDAVAAWYESMRVGATGGELHHAVHDRLDPLGLMVGLNIGHQIASDEWTHSPVAKGSRVRVRSGMYFQADFFPMVKGPHFGAFAEDGLVIADSALRRALASRHPALWKRVAVRRKFMTQQLGIRLSEDVLPLSNFPAAVMPFLLAPNRCPVIAGASQAQGRAA
jgi:Xaa-Pro aminopeptidase